MVADLSLASRKPAVSLVTCVTRVVESEADSDSGHCKTATAV